MEMVQTRLGGIFFLQGEEANDWLPEREVGKVTRSGGESKFTIQEGGRKIIGEISLVNC